MYLRWAERRGFGVELDEVTAGGEAGVAGLTTSQGGQRQGNGVLGRHLILAQHVCAQPLAEFGVAEQAWCERGHLSLLISCAGRIFEW